MRGQAHGHGAVTVSIRYEMREVALVSTANWVAESSIRVESISGGRMYSHMDRINCLHPVT
jgi:hypothetical protein